MRLLIVGCEYAGTTTLAGAFDDWLERVMGVRFRLIHDHFKQPDTQPHGAPLTDDELQQFQALSPRHREVIQRQNLYYHVGDPSDARTNMTSMIVIGQHFDEAVYGPLYYDYGHKGQMGDRDVIFRHIDHRLAKFAPELVLVLVKASPDVIRRRMKESPHPHPLVRPEDVEHVLQRFDEEYFNSIIPNKFTLDTSNSTVEQTVAEFAKKVKLHLTVEDLARMQEHRASGGG